MGGGGVGGVGAWGCGWGKEKAGYEVGLSVVGFFLFQAEDGIRVLVRSRGLGDVYKDQPRI